MTGEDSRWRSADAYRRIERLSPSDIAWEFLRRNPDYIRDYDQFLSLAQREHPGC